MLPAVWMIVSLTIAASSERLPPGAEAVFVCEFDEAADRNYDLWPDNWKRRTGANYPAFIKIGIPEAPASGGPSLQITLDGGAAGALGPPVPIDTNYSYIAECEITTIGHPQADAPFRYDEARLAIEYFDKKGKSLGRQTSAAIRHAPRGTAVRIGPMIPPAGAMSAQLALELEPMKRESLHGAVQFRHLLLSRLPRLVLKSSSPTQIYVHPAKAEVTCEVSGASQPDAELHFTLFDLGQMLIDQEQPNLSPRPSGILAQQTFPLRVKTAEAAAEAHALAKEATGHAAPVSADEAATKSTEKRTLAWPLTLREPGLYRVDVVMKASGVIIHQGSVNIAVIAPDDAPAGGDFGWSLPKGDDRLSLEMLPQLLSQAGIGWVKFPMWYGPQEGRARADRLARFVEELARSKIEVVGLLDQPPSDMRGRFGGEGDLVAASIFAEPELWRPVLDPVLSRLSLKVRWWQLGGDRDLSFLGDPLLQKKLVSAKEQLERYGQETHLGIPWRWINELPGGNEPTYDFVALTSDPPLTGAELAMNLASLPRGKVRRFTDLPILHKSSYDLTTRTRDLVSRMIAARLGAAEATFLPDPFDPDRGLLAADGTPGDLFLPWRTTARALSGAEYLGQIRLPSGSTNYLFARDGKGILIAWNDKSVTEQLYLGDQVTQSNLWGRQRPCPLVDGAQQIAIGPLPSILYGIHLPTAQWSMSTEFSRSELASVFGRPQELGLKFTNAFEQGVRAEVVVTGPDVWDIRPKRFSLNLAAGEEGNMPLEVMLRQDASTGEQTVRLDFEVSAEHTYRFTVFRTIEVGMGDVQIELTSHLNVEGELVVEQRLINTTTKPVSFNCYLFAPDRRRMRRQVIELQQGRDTKIYVLPDGKELIGKTLWVRAEEVDGDRVFNRRMVVEE